MTKYTITINGLESGLTENAIKGMVEGSWPEAESVEVSTEE